MSPSRFGSKYHPGVYGKGPVGQIGYPLEGNPSIYRLASLEGGEEEFIYDAPRLVGGGNLLNLGDLKGGSAILLAQGLRDRNLEGHVTTVDCYLPHKRRASKRNMEKAQVYEYITIMRNSTQAAAEILQKAEARFNFVFIDAGHEYEDVKNDWENFTPMLNSGGMVAFHDTNSEPIARVIKEIDLDIWTQNFWVNRIKAFTRK